MPRHALMFMAQPAEPVRRAVWDLLEAKGLIEQLGGRIFPEQNWHQSFSGRVELSTDQCDRMIRAGARVHAAAFTLELNRVASHGKAGDPQIIWTVHPTERPTAFDALVAATREAMRQEGVEKIEDMAGNAPHVTVCYWAPAPLESIVTASIPWRIDELLLVESRMNQHHEYHYHTLARWPLRAAPAGLESQPELW